MKDGWEGFPDFIMRLKTEFKPISTKPNENETWTHYNPAQTNQRSAKRLKCMTWYPYPKSTTGNIGLWWPYQSIQQASTVANKRNVEGSRYFTVKNLPPRRCKLMNPPFLTLCSGFFLCSIELSVFLPQARFLLLSSMFCSRSPLQESRKKRSAPPLLCSQHSLLHTVPPKMRISPSYLFPGLSKNHPFHTHWCPPLLLHLTPSLSKETIFQKPLHVSPSPSPTFSLPN